MNMLNFCISFLVFGAVWSEQAVQYSGGNEQPKPFSELPCLMSGGICLTATHCPEGRLAKVSGLCPIQQRSGVECCHGLSKYETRCGHRGGECMEKDTCPDKLIDRVANDCEGDKRCCTLVK